MHVHSVKCKLSFSLGASQHGEARDRRGGSGCASQIPGSLPGSPLRRGGGQTPGPVG